MEKHFVKGLYSCLMVVMIVFLLGMAWQENKLEGVTVFHTVKQGETLWEIGEKYITPDRYMPEFIEGIYELNYDKVFANREKNGAPRKSVYLDDVLEIRYWKTQASQEGSD